MHRRPPFRSRRYLSSQALVPTAQLQKDEPSKEALVLNNIPLPNESDSPAAKSPSRMGSPFGNLFSKIHIDDLILLGLVLLFIDEGLNEAEDDFLIVILLYLFISGIR